MTLVGVHRFIKTKIMSDIVVQHLTKAGIEFAEVEDSAGAAMRIISDPKVVGRSLAIVPRSIASRGYKDIDSDDYEPGTFLAEVQDMAAGGTHRAKVNVENRVF